MWANLARKAADVEAPVSQEPIQCVVAVQNSQDEVDQDMANIHKNTVVDLPTYSKGLLVLDANAIIKGMDDYLSTADCFVTTPQVVGEIKDRTARDLLDRLPYKLVVLDPTDGSLAKVVEVAQKTGDFGTLSRTDIRLAALALDCAVSTGSLKDEIVPCTPQVNPNNANNTVKEVTEEQDEEQIAQAAQPGDEEEATAQEGDDAKSDASVDSWDDPEAGEWITPDNINKVRQAEGMTKFEGGFACATSDFPVQNVLLHVGVPIVGPQGMKISQLRMWLLRCHACYHLVHDTTRQFCPSCGSGDTLKRVSYTVNEKGEKHLFINFKRQISTRGTVFALPKPRGGRHGTNKTLALREDQLAHVIRGQANARRKEQKIQEDDDLAVFGEVSKKKRSDPNQLREKSSYGRGNMNEKKKQRAGRRK